MKVTCKCRISGVISQSEERELECSSYLDSRTPRPNSWVKTPSLPTYLVCDLWELL